MLIKHKTQRPMPEMPDPITFAALYRDHHRWLRARLRGWLGCAETAADLTQDTFVKIWERGGMPEIKAPRALLTHIAAQLLSNYRRRQRIERAYLAALGQQAPEYMVSPETQLQTLEALLEIDQRLAGLPLAVRRAFFYARLDGLSYGEIAARMGISVSTVKRYLRRAAMQCYFALPG